MNYSELTNKYGFIRSKTDLLSSEENYSSRRREGYEPPEPYVPLDQRFYKYAGIEHPTITLDPQAYKNHLGYDYFQKNKKDRKDVSSSSQSRLYDDGSSQSSENGNCYAHHEVPRTKVYQKRHTVEDSSSFELSPYEELESESDDSFSREHDYHNEQKDRREKQLMKQTHKGMRDVMEQSEELDYSGDSSALRLQEQHQNHRKSIDKIQKARNIVKQKLRTQQYEKKANSMSSSSQSQQEQQFLESARFNQNIQNIRKERDQTQREQQNRNNKVSRKKHHKQESSSEQQSPYKRPQEKKRRKQKKDRKRIELQEQELVQKYEGRQFVRTNDGPKPILRKQLTHKSQEKGMKQTINHHIQSRDESVQVGEEIVKENNPENHSRKYKLLQEKEARQQKRSPVAFNIDNYRDLTLSQAFKLHCADLRQKLKQERHEFKGHHEHQKRERKQRKRNASKTRTFVRNKFKNSTKYYQLGTETHQNTPFTGKNNPLQQFKRMDIIRRRQLAKKYDKVQRMRLLY